MSNRISVIQAFKRLLQSTAYITAAGEHKLLKQSFRELCTHFQSESESEKILYRTEVAIVLAAEMGMDITCICTALLIEIPEEKIDFKKKIR